MKPLSMIGSGVNQIVTAARERKAEAERQAKYTEVLTNFYDTGDTSLLPEIQQLYPEKFAGITETWDKMDEISRKRNVQSNMEVITNIDTGNIEKAADQLAIMARAHREEGDVEQAEGLQQMSKTLLAGDTTAVQRYLESITGVIPEGVDALENWRSMNQERRDEGGYALKVMETGAGLEKDQGALDAMTEAAKKDPRFGEVNLAALKYGQALEGGMELDPTEFNKNIFGLRAEFQKKADAYNQATIASGQLGGILEKARSENDPDAVGLLDISAINTFQRMIDPATVREGDVNLIQSAKSLAERLDVMVKGWKKGAVLSEPQRKEMEAIAEQLSIAQKAFVDEVIYPSIYASHKRLDPKGTTYDEVFSGYTPPNAIVVKQPVQQTEELLKAKAFFADTAKASLSAGDGIWSKAELDKINDPNTSLQELEKMGKTTWNKYKAQGQQDATTPAEDNIPDDLSSDEKANIY